MRPVRSYNCHHDMLVKAAPKPLRWQRSKYSLFARRRDIFAAAVQFALFLWWDRLFDRTAPEQRTQRARWLVQTLLDLGPTFIKIGQALSTRADLLPLEYVQALGQLQDRVPEFSSDEAIALIQSELQGSLHSLYRDFDRFPIAAASLGQVHKARLHTGEEVVVKVQRPGLEKLFNLDFQVLYQLVQWSERLFRWTRKYNLEAIYNEFRTLIYQEIDYLQEAKHADRFRKNFQDNPRLIVPKVYWRYTTAKVMTMEYLPGIKIDDRQTLEAFGIDTREINQIGICSYLKQLLIDGFFQADPHPGNMAVTQDGRLIFYDFGMMSEVNSLNRDQMIQTFFAILKKDTDTVVETLTAMGLIEPMSDMTPVRRLIQFLLDKFRDRPVDVQAFAEIKEELYVMFEQQPFRLPAQMTYILKALTTLDGIARSLDPQYNLIAAAQPFVKSITVSRGGAGAIGELARQTRDFIRYRLRAPSPLQVSVQRLEERLERGELQVRVRSIESDRALRRIDLALKSLIYTCACGFSVLAGIVSIAASQPNWAIAAFCLSAFSLVFLLRSLVKLSVRERLDKLAQK